MVGAGAQVDDRETITEEMMTDSGYVVEMASGDTAPCGPECWEREFCGR